MDNPNFLNDYVFIKKSDINGLGVFAKTNILKDFKIQDYKGVEMKWVDYKNKYNKEDRKHFYLIRYYHKPWIIYDGKPYLTENISHYCNESNTPNVILKKGGLYSIKDIKKDEELLLKYPKFYHRNYVLN